MPRRGGLGKGLESLIPTSPRPVDDEETHERARQEEAALEAARRVRAERFAGDEQLPYRELPVDRIDPNPKQPRTTWDEAELQELTDSVKLVGVLQPIVVRAVGDRFQVVMGERRLRASRAAGLERIPAVLRDTGDEFLLRDALLENVHRQNLNPLEEAAAYENLLADFGINQEQLAERVGKSRPAISNALRLLRLPSEVQKKIASGVLSAGHGRAVASVNRPDLRERFADRIVQEGLTVRQAEELAGRINRELAESADEAKPVKRPVGAQRPNVRAPKLLDLEELLSDRLSTRVKVQIGKHKSKVLIEFATLDDLQRIVDAIGVDDGAGDARGTTRRGPGLSAVP